ncbi:MAG: ABC transporter permease, partial [Brachybacterium sp.]|nr:ABC transporter permease [Brachybacterium sp.]
MTLSNPEPLGEDDSAATDLAAEAGTVTARRRTPWYLRLPIISHLRSSVGLQRGMLITGVVLVVVLLLSALLAPLIAPYGFAQTS